MNIGAISHVPGIPGGYDDPTDRKDLESDLSKEVEYLKELSSNLDPDAPGGAYLDALNDITYMDGDLDELKSQDKDLSGQSKTDLMSTWGHSEVDYSEALEQFGAPKMSSQKLFLKNRI